MLANDRRRVSSSNLKRSARVLIDSTSARNSSGPAGERGAISSPIERTVKDRHGILGTIAAKDKIIVVCDIFGMIDALKQKLNILKKNTIDRFK